MIQICYQDEQCPEWFSTMTIAQANKVKIKQNFRIYIPSRPERPSGMLQNHASDWFLAMMLPAVGDTKY
eukprot:1617985-Ditylum_brightwellii.AAC.1